MVSLIMIGGPQTMAIVFSAVGATCSRIVGTKPTLPFQSGVSPPGSTVVTSFTSLRAAPLGQLVLVDQVGDRAARRR